MFLNKQSVRIFSFLCAFGALIYPVQGQPGLGGTNLFNNSGMIDSGPNSTYSSNPYNAMNQLLAPKMPLGKRQPGEVQPDVDEDWQPAYLQPFPINYLNIPQLSGQCREIISLNYFAAMNGPEVKTFTQLYKDNRAENVSSFITADSIAHPFLAFQNSIRLAVATQSIAPLLKALLVSMIETGKHDYLEAEDLAIKDEIKYNLAYLLVALKLLQPAYVIADFAGVKQLVEGELHSIKQKRPTYSVIFHRQQNFASLEPIGWQKATPAGQQFFSCCQWLGIMSLNLSDSESSNGNEFRRAFLLFQTLMKAQVAQGDHHDDSGYVVWQKINEMFGLLGLNLSDDTMSSFQIVLPSSFAGIFPNSKSVSRITLASLSNPLNRTRLFLTLRGNEPRKQLDRTSIFSLNEIKKENERQLKFCLINPIYQPDFESCFKVPPVQKDAASGFSLTPIGLILAQSRGSTWAKRVLVENASKLSDRLPTDNASETNTFWQTFKNLNPAYMQPAPQVFQTKQWRTFCLEREIAAWVDKMLVCSPDTSAAKANNQDKPAENTAANSVTINSVIRKFGIASWRTTNTFNYLEPVNTFYEKLAEAQTNFEKNLSQANLLSPQYAERSRDFTRLLKRLSAIATVELNNQAVSAEDQSLLAGIDKVLEAIEPPLPGNLYVPFGGIGNNVDLAASVIADKSSNTQNGSSAKKVDESAVIKFSDSVNSTDAPNSEKESKASKLTGVNMGLGYPSCVYVIVVFKRAYYLLRGAAYSYHEQSGSPIYSSNWQKQLDAGFYRDAPFWCQSFQR